VEGIPSLNEALGDAPCRRPRQVAASETRSGTMPGPMTPAHDFRLYHSNALDVLAGLLAEELRQDVPGQPLLAPDTVLIPPVAVRRWLQAPLARRHT